MTDEPTRHASDTFAALAHRAPGDLVCVGRDGARTLVDLLDDVAHVAAHLDARHLTADDELVIVCRDRYRFLVALLAAWQRGGRVALPPNAQRGTIEALTGGHTDRVVHDGPASAPGAANDIVELTPDGIDLRELLAAPRRADAPNDVPRLRGDAVVVTLYTSGTTATHQAARKTAAQLYLEARLLAATFAIEPAARIVSTVPPHHIYGLLFSVLVPLVAGASFVRETPLHAEAVAHALRTHAARVLVSVPAHLRSFEALAPLGRDAPALTFSSSAPLPTATARMLGERHGMEATEVLGSTETGGIAWRRLLHDPMWTVFDGLEVDVDADGRLLLDSPFLPPDAPRPMPCGDRVRLAADDARGRQRFDYRGRVDDVVKVGGKRVTLGEVTRRLLSIEGVEDAAVQAVDVTTGHGRALRAAVVAPGHTARTLRMALRHWLDPVVLPRPLVLVDALPRDARGKLPRRALDALFDHDHDPDRATIALGPPIAHDDGRRVTCRVDVPRRLVFFDGHFPGNPVLAGVVQLDRIVLPAVRRSWPGLASLARIRRLKFRAPVHPGDTLELEMIRCETHRVDFILRNVDGMTMHSDGSLAYDGVDGDA